MVCRFWFGKMEEKWKKSMQMGKYENWKNGKNGRKMEEKWKKTVFRHRFGGNGKMGERMS